MMSAEEAASVGMPNLLRSGSARQRDAVVPFRIQPCGVAALALGRRDAVARVTEVTIDRPAGPIRLRLYSPEGGRELRPARVWLHGGPFMIRGMETADSICRSLANTSGCVIVAAKYQLAPEHDLFAGHEDGLCVLEWLVNSDGEFGVDPSRLAVGGDFAGGKLAVVLAQEWRRRDRPKLRGDGGRSEPAAQHRQQHSRFGGSRGAGDGDFRGRYADCRPARAGRIVRDVRSARYNGSGPSAGLRSIKSLDRVMACPGRIVKFDPSC
jgi:alpha/beta hydrolase fold